MAHACRWRCATAGFDLIYSVWRSLASFRIDEVRKTVRHLNHTNTISDVIGFVDFPRNVSATTRARPRRCAHANANLMGTGKQFKVLPRTQDGQEGGDDASLPFCRLVRSTA